jgi:DNA-binding IclR family transcriptional regulator
MAEPRDGVIARAFTVLGCFDDRSAALPLTELARRARLPVNTTLRLARHLTAVGALERGVDGRFTIGLRLFEIAALAPRGLGLRPAALPFMTDLLELTGQHVALIVREDDEAVLVERLSPHGPIGLEYRVGGRMPLARTGAGLVLLAWAPPATQERATDAVGPDQTIDGVRTGDDLRRLLADIRLTGSMCGSRSTPRPMETVAVPVRDVGGSVVAALSVVAPVGAVDVRALVPTLVASARAISRDAYGRRAASGGADRR